MGGAQGIQDFGMVGDGVCTGAKSGVPSLQKHRCLGRLLRTGNKVEQQLCRLWLLPPMLAEGGELARLAAPSFPNNSLQFGLVGFRTRSAETLTRSSKCSCSRCSRFFCCSGITLLAAHVSSSASFFFA